MHYLASTDIRRYLFLLIMGIESIAMQIFNLIILSLYSINFFLPYLLFTEKLSLIIDNGFISKLFLEFSKKCV